MDSRRKWFWRVSVPVSLLKWPGADILLGKASQNTTLAVGPSVTAQIKVRSSRYRRRKRSACTFHTNQNCRRIQHSGSYSFLPAIRGRNNTPALRSSAKHSLDEVEDALMPSGRKNRYPQRNSPVWEEKENGKNSKKSGPDRQDSSEDGNGLGNATVLHEDPDDMSNE